jgi:hypothetical protein
MDNNSVFLPAIAALAIAIGKQRLIRMLRAVVINKVKITL